MRKIGCERSDERSDAKKDERSDAKDRMRMF